jgi:transposase-like protein
MAEPKRFYKPEEKLRIVLEGLSGTIQISELCRKYDIKPARFYNWKEKLLQSSQIFDDRGRKPNIDEKIRSKDEEIARLKDVIAEITQENLALKKKIGGYGGRT